MSLQVWLPLNGTLDNYGLSPVTVKSGTPIYTSYGKLSSTGLDLSSRVSFQAPKFARLQTFSITFWARVNSDTTLQGDWMDILGFNSLSSSGSTVLTRFETCYSTSYPNYGIGLFGSGAILSTNPARLTNTIKDEWYHCSLIVDYANRKINIYLNGDLIKTYTHAGGMFNTLGEFYLGQTNTINGCIQDVRFYDHALSTKEVKEISKALVLHYKLDLLTSDIGNNLLKDSNFVFQNSYGTNWSHPWGTTTVNEVKNNMLHITKVQGQSYGGISQTIGEGYSNNSLIRCDIYPYTCSVLAKGTGKLVIWCHYRSSEGGSNISQTYKTFDLTDEWKIYSYTFPIYTNSNYSAINRFNLMIGLAGGVDTPGEAYIQTIKLEQGSQATEWIPHSSEPLYTQLGFNPSIEYDRGVMNIYDGIKVGQFEYSTDTPRYRTAPIFTNDANQYIHTPALEFLNLKDGITFSCWAKQTSISTLSGGQPSTRQYIISQGRDFHGADAVSTYGINIYSSNGVIVGSADDTIVTSDTTFDLNSWYHIVLTANEEKVYLYINGKLNKTVNTKTSSDIWGNNQGRHFAVGKMSHAYTGTTTYFPFVGSISDVRIYATTLSAKDILELYQTAALIDNHNNLYAYEYMEQEVHS